MSRKILFIGPEEKYPGFGDLIVHKGSDGADELELLEEDDVAVFGEADYVFVWSGNDWVTGKALSGKEVYFQEVANKSPSPDAIPIPFVILEIDEKCFEKPMKNWCGYCKLKEWEKYAAKYGKTVTIQSSINNVGFDVYVHPSDIKIPNYVGRRDEDLPEYWKIGLSDNYARGCYCDKDNLA